MQYSLKPLPSFNLQVQSIAVGQDHTLALTATGDVYSWGLNRFSQLGYVVELSSTATARHEEPIQSVPKRVVGPLRREVVCGVAASKNASACWTKDTVFTWGTNTGQLGTPQVSLPLNNSHLYFRVRQECTTGTDTSPSRHQVLEYRYRSCYECMCPVLVWC